ncbi:MAG: insulinase family protein, partial [Candidatus Kuenenia stuttgartiensis]|nr:insulinase family protein [Candidatus Kuenenia stuttgartiensis]
MIQTKRLISFAIVNFLVIFLISLKAHAEPLKLDVKEHVLGNGLKLLMLEKHEVPIVCLRINFRVGSVDERPGITGVSHLFEHMMFKGTKIFGTKDYAVEKPLLEKEDALVAEIAWETGKELHDKKKIAALEKELQTTRGRLRDLAVKDEIFSL